MYDMMCFFLKDCIIEMTVNSGNQDGKLLKYWGLFLFMSSLGEILIGNFHRIELTDFRVIRVIEVFEYYFTLERAFLPI